MRICQISDSYELEICPKSIVKHYISKVKSAMIRVLLVDDDPMILDLTKTFLERSGNIRADALQSAAEAIDKLQGEAYDVVVSDYVMPEMDGITFLKLVRKRHPNLPFILFTGKSREEVVIEALNCGADYFLQKDGDTKTLYVELSHQVRQAAERVKTKKALENSEMRYRSFAQNFHGIAFRCKFDLSPIFIHGQVEEISGYTEEEMLSGSQSWYGIIHPDDTFKLSESTEKLRTIPDHSMSRSYRILHKNGEIRWIYETAKNICDESGTPYEIEGAAYDVTERKISRKQILAQRDLSLKLSETTSLKVVLENCLDTAMNVAGADCGTTYLIDNDSGNIVLTYSKGLSEDFVDFISHRKLNPKKSVIVMVGKPLYIQHHDRGLLHQERREQEGLRAIAAIPLIHRGHVIGYYSVGSHTIDEIPNFCHNTLETIGAMAGNAVARIQAVDKLHKSERELQSLFNSLQDIIFVIDLDGFMLRVNHAAEKILGYAPCDLLNKNWLELHPVDPRDEVANIVTKAMDGSEMAWTGDIRAKDGNLVPVETKFAPGRWNNQDVVFGICRDVTERKGVEDSLRNREEQLRAIFEAAESVSFVITDAQNPKPVVIESSPGTEKIFGYKRDEIVGKKVSKLLLPEDIANLLDMHRMMRVGEWDFSGEVTLVRKSGEKFPAIFSKYPLRDKKGSTYGVLNVSIDISEQKRALEALQESETRFRDLTDLLPQTVFETDRRGKITFANRAAFKLFDYSQADLEQGICFPDMFVPEQRAKLKEAFKEALAGRIGEIVKYTGMRKDGSDFPAAIYVDPILQDGDVAGLRGILLDISKIQSAERALRESEDRLDLAVESANLVIWDWNPITGEVVRNDRYAKMLGYCPSELSWRADELVQSIHPEDLPSVNKALQDHLEGKAPSVEVEYRLKHKDGCWVWVHSKGWVEDWDGKGRPARMIGIDLDITEMRQYQEALKEANKKLNLLSSVTRHDLLNQIAGMSGYAQLLSEILSSDPNAQKYIDRILELTQRIRRQVLFTRDYQDLGMKSPEWQNVATVIKSAAKDVHLEGVQLKITTGQLEIFADPMLEKVFSNLLENVCRHGDGATKVLVSFCEQNGKGVIVFEDDGIGIPEDMKNKIFERAFGKHTGYGLFLAREILGITGIDIKEAGVEGVRFEIEASKEHYRINCENAHDF